MCDIQIDTCTLTLCCWWQILGLMVTMWTMEVKMFQVQGLGSKKHLASTQTTKSKVHEAPPNKISTSGLRVACFTALERKIHTLALCFCVTRSSGIKNPSCTATILLGRAHVNFELGSHTCVAVSAGHGWGSGKYAIKFARMFLKLLFYNVHELFIQDMATRRWGCKLGELQ